MRVLWQAWWQWRRVGFFLLVAGALWGLLTSLGGCAQRPVTVRGEPMTDATIVQSVQTVHVAEQILAAVPGFLIRGHQQNVIPVAVLEDYSQQHVPAAQAALDQAREALLAYAEAPGPSTHAKVVLAMTAVHTALLKASTLLQQYGGTP